MCQMKVVLDENGKEDVIMENVTRLQVSDTAIEVAAFFEAPIKVEEVFIETIDFLEGKVVLKKRMG
jgi:predicted RNA-binding protein